MYMQNLMACFYYIAKKKGWLKRVIAVVCREHWFAEVGAEPVALSYASITIFMLLLVSFLCVPVFLHAVWNKNSQASRWHSPELQLSSVWWATHVLTRYQPACLWKMTLQGSFTAMGWQWHIDGLVAMTVKVESLICVFHLSWQVSLQHFIW